MNECNLNFFKRELERMLSHVKERETETRDRDLAMFYAGARHAYQDALDILRIACTMEADHDE